MTRKIYWRRSEQVQKEMNSICDSVHCHIIDSNSRNYETVRKNLQSLEGEDKNLTQVS